MLLAFCWQTGPGNPADSFLREWSSDSFFPEAFLWQLRLCSLLPGGLHSPSPQATHCHSLSEHGLEEDKEWGSSESGAVFGGLPFHTVGSPSPWPSQPLVHDWLPGVVM